MPSKSSLDTTETPPTLMSRSRVAGQPARHERVGQHDGPAPAGAAEVGAHASHRLGERRLVGAGREPPRLVQRLRVEVGDAVDRDRPVGVLEQHRRADRRRVRADVDTGSVEEPGAEAEPLGGVVVARDEHDPGTRRSQPRERLVREPDGVDVGERAVVDVTRDDHQVDALGRDDLEQVVDVRRLVLEHADAMERASQVPVGGVEDPHRSNLGSRPHAVTPAAESRKRRSGRRHKDAWNLRRRHVTTAAVG